MIGLEENVPARRVFNRVITSFMREDYLACIINRYDQLTKEEGIKAEFRQAVC